MCLGDFVSYKYKEQFLPHCFCNSLRAFKESISTEIYKQSSFVFSGTDKFSINCLLSSQKFNELSPIQ